MMTFREFFEAVCTEMGESYVSVSIEATRYKWADGAKTDVAFSAWDGTRHHRGPTPELALMALKASRVVSPAWALEAGRETPEPGTEPVPDVSVG